MSSQTCLLSLDDFNRIEGQVPHTADLKPAGKSHMSDLDRVGGVPSVMQELLDAGWLHGCILTVTGKPAAENLAAIEPPRPDGSSIHSLHKLTHAEVGINIPMGIARLEGDR